MKERIQGGRSWQANAYALLVVPAVAVLLGLMGVTSGPLLSVREARLRYGLAEHDLAQLHDLTLRLSELRRGADPERLRAEAARLDGLLPTRLEALDVFTVLRLAAATSGLALDAIELGASHDLAAEIDGQTVYLQDARISTEADPATLTRFVGDVRAAGFPAVVLELSMARGSTRRSTFQSILHLGLLHRGPPAPPVPGAAGVEDLVASDW